MTIFFVLSKRQKAVAAIFISVVVLSDLLFAFSEASRLYDWQPSASHLLETSMAPRAGTLNLARSSYPKSPVIFAGRQAPRYLSLLYQEPYALEGLIHFKNQTHSNYPVPFAEALAGARWNSFFVTTSYLSLVNSNISPNLIEKAFRIGRSPFYLLNSLEIEALENSDSKTVLGEISVVRSSANQLMGSIDNRGANYLYWADGFDRWWQAAIDGKSTAILKSFWNFKALEIPKGRHFVTMDYVPVYFLIGVFTFYGSIFVPMLVLLLARISRSMGIRLSKRQKCSVHFVTPLPTRSV